MKKPYPEDCELGTESATPSISWTGSGVGIAADQTYISAGDYSLKATFSGAGYVQYPDGSVVDYLDKIVDSWSDLFLWVRCNTPDVTFTVRLYDKDENYAYETFTLRQENVSQYIWLDLDNFTDILDWDDVRVQYIRIYVNKACTVYIDNLCFADSWAFSAPSGKFHVSVADNVPSESPPSEGYPFFVTYSYDPFLASVPRRIAEAAEWLVGVYIIDHLRGLKYQELDMEMQSETLEADTPFQRGGMLGVRTNMLKNYDRAIGRWMYGGSYGVI
jgi:hypothetical protein